MVLLRKLTLRRPGGGLSWTARAVVAAVLVSGSTAATVGLAVAAQAQVRPATTGNSAIVVHEAIRAPFGKILTTDSGRSLYVHPNGPCNASCRSIWPPLLMPVGTTTPKGANCLGTALLGSRLQVTYQDLRLYSFTGDSGTSVNGNGVAGFKVAKVLTTCSTRAH